MDTKQVNELIEEVRSVKKLLVLRLLQEDISQRQIASMLGVSEATMSRMIPKGATARRRSKATAAGSDVAGVNNL